jgi:tetraacyldisaccharide 4'-kinase
MRLLKGRKLPGRVVSVGNIAVGGTGKSPVVAWIAAALVARGQRPAILTRGYGSDLRGDDSLALLGGAVLMRARRAERLPDEARMQSVALPGVPVIAGPRRYEAAKRFLAEHADKAPTHWLLDDGFQHRQLARDVDVVLLDAGSPFGNGMLLPRGMLREPVDALKRASVVVFTRATASTPSAADVAKVRAATTARTYKAVFETGDLVSPQHHVFDATRHAPVLVVSGIADPTALRRELAGRGIGVGDELIVPDHGRIVRAEVARRSARAAGIVTTAKDYWRDPAAFADLDRPVFILPLAVRLDDEAALAAVIA